MEPYTLDRNFHKRDVVDGFESIIWTERYYGNSEVELSVPATVDMVRALPLGTFLSIPESDEVMILETMDIEDSKLKITGISLLPWMNNRFIRTDKNHEVTSWTVDQPDQTPGWLLWAILWNMCHKDSPFLQPGSLTTGITNPEKLAIPGLSLNDYDKSGKLVKTVIPYGPVYDRMREIAEAYEIGMQITLDSVTDTSYSLGFRSYKGLDRTSSQTTYPAVRFSPMLDSLTKIHELRSIAALKTLIYAYADGLPEKDYPGLVTGPGKAELSESAYVGFDLRAHMITESLTVDMVGGKDASSGPPPVVKVPGDPAQVNQVLTLFATKALEENSFVAMVDGEIVPTSQFQYGVHYNLGDIIEVQGNSPIVSAYRVTEYIRAQDEAGERSYPTVTMLTL